MSFNVTSVAVGISTVGLTHCQSVHLTFNITSIDVGLSTVGLSINLSMSFFVDSPVLDGRDVEAADEAVDVDLAAVGQRALLELVLDSQLILADVHQLFRRLQLRGDAPLEVRLRLPAFERLAGEKDGR